MKRIVPLLLTALAVLAAEDPWVQVRELKSGAELRIYRVNTKQPLQAKFDRASDENLIVVTKTGQVSIPKELIERLDCRRAPSPQVVKDTRVDRKIGPKRVESANGTLPGVTTAVKTRLGVPSKSAFEKIYDRTPEAK
jgi:bifunctional DNA-binding transcriptional regulator/antitoxin component of YhaV-PrlF toxin-antitoxin module